MVLDRPAASRWLAASAGLTVLAVALLLLSRPLGIPGIVPKMTASTGFLLMAWAAGAFNSRYGIAIFVGLFFSWWGDLFLALPGTFLFGLVAFLLGHIAYSVAFLLWGVRWPGVGAGFAVLALPGAGLFFWLNPHLGEDMRYPVYAYMIVITSMVALSVGAWRNGGAPIMVVAALMFWLSDICVARQQFVADSPLNPLIGLPLYFGGQMVFAYSIKIANRIRAIA